MKKLIAIVGLCVVVGLGVYAWKLYASKSISILKGNGAIPEGAVVIAMNQDDYEPSEVSIKRGTTVVFVNKSTDWRWPASNLHPTHDIYPAFDPKEPVAPEATWMFRFDQVGAWRMHDHLAPYITGTITVKE